MIFLLGESEIEQPVQIGSKNSFVHCLKWKKRAALLLKLQTFTLNTALSLGKTERAKAEWSMHFRRQTTSAGIPSFRTEFPIPLFFTANAYNQIGEFNRSADSFKTLVERFPESPLFLEAKSQACRCLFYAKSFF